jgi:hypothetical protein
MFRERLTCVACDGGSTYKVTKKAYTCSHCNTEISAKVADSDQNRVRRKLCAPCYKREMLLQMEDEIGGFLGNREYHGDNNLVAMAKSIVAYGWAGYYGASEYQVFIALKAIQGDGVLDIEDGDTKTLGI